MIVTRKRLDKFITDVADIKPKNNFDNKIKCYYSKFDGSYFTMVGMENYFKPLFKRGIIEQLQAISSDSKVTAIGFSPTKQKWYGWSHRAIYGFGVGSTCGSGDCHYQPSNEAEFVRDCIEFWHDKKSNEWTKAHVTEERGIRGVQIDWKYNNKTRNKKVRNVISGCFISFPKEFGRGYWVAKSLEDAKQMAIDFANGVS